MKERSTGRRIRTPQHECVPAERAEKPRYASSEEHGSMAGHNPIRRGDSFGNSAPGSLYARFSRLFPPATRSELWGGLAFLALALILNHDMRGELKRLDP